MKPLNVVVFGAGEWGKNYLRLFQSDPRVGRIRAVETSPDRQRWLKTLFASVEILSDPEEGWNSDFPCVVIALPASMHFEYLRRAIEEKKHILVEKPAVVNMQEAEKITRLLGGYDKAVMVGHVFLYNPAIIKLKKLIEDGTLAPVYFLKMTRTNFGPIRSDVDCLKDLAPHDISIMLYLLGELPEQVSAIGSAFLNGKNADVAFANYRFRGGPVASIHVSWLAPKKTRELTVVAENGMAVFDDAAPLEKLRLYERGVKWQRDYRDYGEFQMIVQDSDVHIPRLSPTEPLMSQVDAYLDAVISGKPPLTDWQHGMDVVRALCATEESLKANGAPVRI